MFCNSLRIEAAAEEIDKICLPDLKLGLRKERDWSDLAPISDILSSRTQRDIFLLALTHHANSLRITSK